MFIDACFSGNFIQKNDLMNNYHYRLSKQFFANRHYHILTSSSSSQRTWNFDYSYSKAMYYWCYCCGLDVKKEKWIEPIPQEMTLGDIYAYTSLQMKKDNEHYLQTSSKDDDLYIQDICIYPKEDLFKIF